jgi:hypothetical protein
VDYLATTLKPIDNDSFGPMRLSDWDQSNWVELDFTGLDDAATLANAGVGQLIAAGSVTGDYVDDLNYRIKLDKKADLFGMGKNKHWTLLANSYDATLSIDRIVGYIGEQMGLDYTPRAVPVDLFLNGKYYGNYLLMEEVRVDENRVDIDVVDENVSDLDSLDITGDYLLGVNRKPTALPYEYFLTKRGHAFTWDTPEYEVELSEAEQAQQKKSPFHIRFV